MLTDWGLLARAILALALVLILMAAVAWVARRFLARGGLTGLTGKRRLAVVEQTMLDGKSRLLLIRRDNTEHLLVLGPSGTTVVESGIQGAATPAPESAADKPGAAFEAPR